VELASAQAQALASAVQLALALVPAQALGARPFLACNQDG
jgi:hypothetical protein